MMLTLDNCLTDLSKPSSPALLLRVAVLTDNRFIISLRLSLDWMAISYILATACAD